MADIDGGIPASAGKGQPTMMEGLGKIAGTMNAVNQNRLFIGRQAAGDALQKSINPETGEIDFGTFNKLITANPRIAPYAQEAMSQALAQRGQDVLNTTNKARLAEVYSANLRQDISATTSPEAALGAVLRGIAAGRYPKEFASGFIGGADLGAMIKEAAVASGSETAMEAQFGTPGAVETGGTNVGVVTNRVTGTRSAMGGDAAEIDKELTPEAKATLVDVVDPVTGIKKAAPRSAIVTETGEPRPGGAFTDESGAVQTTLAPGATEARSVAGQQSAQMAMALTQRASRVPENKAILGNMDGLIGEMDSRQLGPQSGFWKGLGQIAAQYNMDLLGAPPKDKTAAQEEFSKLAFQLAQSQFQALGGTGTDTKLNSTMNTSPSEMLTRYGNKGIIALLKGNEDAVAAQSDAWQKWMAAGNGPESYDRFLNQWNKIYDPRVFQSQYMDASGRKTMLNGMTATEKKQFEASYKRAAGLGWVQP